MRDAAAIVKGNSAFLLNLPVDHAPAAAAETVPYHATAESMPYHATGTETVPYHAEAVPYLKPLVSDHGGECGAEGECAGVILFYHASAESMPYHATGTETVPYHAEAVPYLKPVISDHGASGVEDECAGVCILFTMMHALSYAIS